MLPPQLQCTWLNNSSLNPIQIHQLKTQLSFPTSNVEDACPIIQHLPAKGIYQEPAETFPFLIIVYALSIDMLLLIHSNGKPDKDCV